MNDIITQNLLTFILGGGLLSFITGVITLKYTKKQAEAKAVHRYIKCQLTADGRVAMIQDVYQELIADLRADKEAMKKERIESETKWATRIEKLENNQIDQDKKIADNENEIADLKRFKCINLLCNNRKQ